MIHIVLKVEDKAPLSIMNTHSMVAHLNVLHVALHINYKVSGCYSIILPSIHCFLHDSSEVNKVASTIILYYTVMVDENGCTQVGYYRSMPT